MASRVQKFLLFGLICILTGYVVYLFAPDYIHLFVQEDHLVEVLSALSYLVAFALGVWIYKNYRRWRMFTVAVMVLGPLGFFSELSFGEDYFDLDMPVVYDVKIDAAHDLVMLKYVLMEEQIGKSGVILLALLTGLALIALVYYKRDFFKKLTGDILHYQPGIFLFLFVFFLGSAVLIDLKEHYVPYAIVEELFELYAGMSLCFYCISLHELESANQGSGRGIDDTLFRRVIEEQTEESESVAY